MREIADVVDLERRARLARRVEHVDCLLDRHRLEPAAKRLQEHGIELRMAGNEARDPDEPLSRHPRMRTLQVSAHARRIGCREARHAQHGKPQLGELAIDAMQ